MTSDPNIGRSGDAARWEHALERARLGVWDWNLVTGKVVYSRTWKQMLGYDEHELPDDDDLWLQMIHPEDRDGVVEIGDRHIAGETGEIETQFRMRHKDGRWIWILDRGGILEWDEDGNPVRMIGVQTDITAQKEAEADVAHLNELYQLALGASGIAVWQFDEATETVHWDERMCEMFGVSCGPGRHHRDIWRQRLHPDESGEVEKVFEAALTTRRSARDRYRILREDGETRHIEALAKLVSDPNRGVQLVGTARDVTEETSAAEALETEKERLRVLLHAISDAVVSTDTHGRIVYANDAAARLVGEQPAALNGRHVEELFGLREAPLEGFDGPTNVEVALNGEARVLRCNRSPIHTSSGTMSGVVHTFQDVTDEHRRQRDLAHAARHDALTGALNRAAFDEAVQAAIEAAEEAPVALLYIDLDYFKALNDYAGHAAGDAALVAVTAGLQAVLPPTSTIGRLGGDEFAALVPVGADAGAEAEAAAQAALEAVRNAEVPLDARHRQLGASIGVEIVLTSADTATEAMARADDACYAAKAAGRNQIALGKSHGVPEQRRTAIRLASDIGDAMKEGRLRLYGQEIRPLSDPWSAGNRFEILARLVDRSGRIVSPAEFIPAAERFGMARTLDRWIIENALSTYGRYMRSKGGVSLSFNVSAQTISDATLWDFVYDLIDHERIRPNNLIFEITETAALTDFEAAESFIRHARAKGCRIALDDFGSGFSSLEYLRRFTVDMVKIDGIFVEHVATNDFDKAIVSSIAGIARDIGFGLVAEKVEDRKALAVLEELGIDFAQGFLLHRPEPLETIFASMPHGKEGDPAHRPVDRSATGSGSRIVRRLLRRV